MDKAAEAKSYFLSGCNCAQSILCAFHAECGLDLNTAMRLGSGFGGGMARLREVCGAVTGMFMVAGLMRGYADPKDKTAKDAHYALIQSLAESFRCENGSIVCRDLLGLKNNLPDPPVSEARSDTYYKKRPCAELVAMAASILERRLADHSVPDSME